MRVRHTTYAAPKPEGRPLNGLFATVRRPVLPIAPDGKTVAVVPAGLRRRRRHSGEWWEVELRTPAGHSRGFVLGLADAIAEAVGAVAHWRGRGYVMGLNLPEGETTDASR